MGTDIETGGGFETVEGFARQDAVERSEVVRQLFEPAGTEDGAHGARFGHGPGDRRL